MSMLFVQLLVSNTIFQKKKKGTRIPWRNNWLKDLYRKYTKWACNILYCQQNRSVIQSIETNKRPTHATTNNNNNKGAIELRFSCSLFQSILERQVLPGKEKTALLRCQEPGDKADSCSRKISKDSAQPWRHLKGKSGSQCQLTIWGMYQSLHGHSLCAVHWLLLIFLLMLSYSQFSQAGETI